MKISVLKILSKLPKLPTKSRTKELHIRSGFRGQHRNRASLKICQSSKKTLFKSDVFYKSLLQLQLQYNRPCLWSIAMLVYHPKLTPSASLSVRSVQCNKLKSLSLKFPRKNIVLLNLNLCLKYNFS